MGHLFGLLATVFLIAVKVFIASRLGIFFQKEMVSYEYDIYIYIYIYIVDLASPLSKEQPF